MAGLKISYADMHAAGATLTAGQSTMEAELGRLQGAIDNLVREGFTTDSAGPAFEGAYTEFHKGVGQVLEGLSGMAKYLTSAAQAFSDADTQLASALKS